MWYVDREKLAKDIRQKRLVDEPQSRYDAAKEVGVTDEKMSKMEKYTSSDIYLRDFIRVCNWLGRNPADYVTVSQDPRSTGAI